MSDFEILIDGGAARSKASHNDKSRPSIGIDLILTISKEIETKAKQLYDICEFRGQDYEETHKIEVKFIKWATTEYKNRKKRANFFPSDIFFGEPAWDILLDLAIQKCAGREISVTSACIASGAPMTTALRWVSVLEAEGLAMRQQDPMDKRRFFLAITDAGFEKIYEYYISIHN